MDFKKAIQISFASSSVAHSQCCANLLQWPLTEKQQENKTALIIVKIKKNMKTSLMEEKVKRSRRKRLYVSLPKKFVEYRPIKLVLKRQWQSLYDSHSISKFNCHLK